MDEQTANLISIGQFAEQTQLSLKALRLYHDKGLLTPAHIDPFSGYRYYTRQQVAQARYIRLLREMEMPLAMIEQFLATVESRPGAAAAVLAHYLQLFEARSRLVHQTARRVSQLLEQKESSMQSEQEICLYDLPPVESGRLLAALKRVLDAADGVLSPNTYRLVGTTATILHGAKTPSKGVDFLMRDHESVNALHLAMATFQTDSPPTYLPEDKQYWASYFVDGVHVGVSTVEWPAQSDGIECCGVGPWQHFSRLPWGQHTVPTVALELRLVSELFRDRPDRYEPLINFMRTKKCDLALLRRGMDERKIAADRQAEVLSQLRPKEAKHV